jgi:AraC-like DNA-binding protein
MPSNVPYREFLPFKKTENLIIFEYVSDKCNVPIHYHQEYEITLLINAKGAKRTIGNQIHILGDIELFLTGPNLLHGWQDDTIIDRKITQVTIQLTDKAIKTLKISKLKKVKQMLKISGQGLVFPKNTALEIKEKITNLRKSSDKKYMAAISDALQVMSTSSYQYLSPTTSQTEDLRFEILVKYIRKNYAGKITLADVASLLDMTAPTFNRFIKKQTGKSFVNFLNHARIAFAGRMLTETDRSIAEVASRAGYNNIANFNRIFKKERNLTPLQYREKFYGSQHFI